MTFVILFFELFCCSILAYQIGKEYAKGIDMETRIPVLKDKFHTVSYNLACDIGKGMDLHLNIETRFDGFGNAIVRFVIIDHDNRLEFEKFDAAAERYSFIIEKHEHQKWQ